MPHSNFMLHEGTMTISGTWKTVVSGVNFAKKDNPVMLEIYTNRMKEKGRYSKLTKANIKKLLQDIMNKKEDVYLTAQQTVDWGLADSIFDGDWQKLRQRLRK